MKEVLRFKGSKSLSCHFNGFLVTGAMLWSPQKATKSETAQRLGFRERSVSNTVKEMLCGINIQGNQE